MLHVKWNKTALFAITMLMHPAYTFTTLYAPVKNGIQKVNNTLEDFFSTENTDLYNQHVAKISNVFSELKKVIKELLQKDNSKYTKQICALGVTVQKKLEGVIVVLNEYKNVPVKGLTHIKLGNALTGACDITQTFQVVTKKIKILKALAQKEQNSQMIKELDELIVALAEIDAIWQKKSNGELLKGLSHRLKHR